MTVVEDSEWHGLPVTLLKSLVGIGGAVGAVIYFSLTFLYQRFYGPLNLDPESVGLTKGVILQRSAAGVVLVAGIGLLVAAYFLLFFTALWALSRGFEWLWTHYHHRRGSEAPTVGDSSWLRPLVYLGLVPGALIGRSAPRRPFTAKAAAIGGGLAVAATLAFSFALAIPRVDHAAHRASTGHSVFPVTVVGVPVLTIASRPCSVTWLGSEPEPKALAGDLHCLGSADGLVFFRTDGTTISVPTTEVATAYRP